MLLAHACVAIQLAGAPATPAAVQALQQRCDGILGGGQCRIEVTAGATPSPTVSDTSTTACWRATVTRAGDDTTASVVLRRPDAPAARVARRDLTFQARDELVERWATLGLVLAALVTLEEHSAAADTSPDAPASAESPSAPARPWISRDLSGSSATASSVGAGEQPGERAAEFARALPRIVDVRLVALGDTGRIPGAALGGRLEVTLEVLRYLDVVAGAAYLTSTRGAAVPVAAGGVGGGNFDLWSMDLGLCPRSRLAHRVSGHVCAGGGLSATTATGFGVADTARVTEWVGDLWTGFDVALHLSRHLALIAEYATEVALSRPVFAIRGAGDVYQRSRYSLNIGLGIAAVF